MSRYDNDSRWIVQSPVATAEPSRGQPGHLQVPDRDALDRFQSMTVRDTATDARTNGIATAAVKSATIDSALR